MSIYKITNKIYTSNCYIIETCEKNAIIIDPNSSNEIIEIIQKENLTPRYIILTHEHYDHVCGVDKIKPYFKDIRTISSKSCSNNLKSINYKKKSFALYLYFMGTDKDTILPDCNLTKSEIEFNDEYVFVLDDCKFELKISPGHSDGSIIIIMNNRYIFSGDSILLEKDIIVKLSGGNKKIFNEYSIPYFKSLDKKLIVMPGHGEKFILEEKFNKDWNK